MRRWLSIISVLAVSTGLSVGTAAWADSPVQMDAAALQACASRETRRP